VFDLVGRGRTAKEIASQLGLSSKTVDVHRARIRGKLNLNTTTDLTHYAVRWVQSKEGGTEI
jgi:DNA-binding CsgD family transcriptional regulator